MTADAVNPFMPAWFDILFSSFFALALLINVAALILVITGIVSISRHRHLLTGTELAVWVAITVLAPGLGAIAWFAIGRRKAREEAGEEVRSART